MNTENKLKIDDFTKALAECINQAQCSVIDPMAYAEIWKEELLELAKAKEPVSDDFKAALEKKVREAQNWTYIEEEGGECPLNEEFGADELEEFAKWGADWQKQQMMAKAVDVTIAIPYSNGYGGYTQLVDSQKALPFGENIKVLVIKED